MVYSGNGDVVNSFITRSSLDSREASYRALLLLLSGLGTKRSIMISEHGEYYLWLGVHDAVADRTGVLEVPLSVIKPGVAGAGQTTWQTPEVRRGRATDV